MQLDTRIALGVQPLQMPQQESPLNRYAQMMQIEAGDQTRQMNALKIQEAQEVMRERNALRALDPAGADYQNQLMRVSPTQGIAYQKAQREAASAKITDLKNQSEIMKNRDTVERQMHQVLSANPTNEAMIATNHVMQTSPFYSPEEKKAFADRLESVFAMPIPERAALFARMGQTPGEASTAATAAAARGPWSPEVEEQRIRVATAGRAPAQPRPEQLPVAVIDPNTGRQVYVSRADAIGKAPAAAAESIAPKEIQKREAAYPQATSALKGFESKSDKFLKDLQALHDHPGLSEISGIAAGRLPGISAKGRAAQALYDKIVAKGGFQALQDLRDASKTGGALGNVSNAEGKQLIASFAAIDRRQDAKDVKAALAQAIGDIEGSKTRMREAYDTTYSYKSNAPAVSTPAALSPEEAAELAALRKRFNK